MQRPAALLAYRLQMSGHHINFDMTPQAFAQDPDVNMLMDDLAGVDPAYTGCVLVSAEDAQAHMGQTLADMSMSDGTGTMTGNGSMTAGGTMTSGGMF